jgi:hypothetical protein
MTITDDCCESEVITIVYENLKDDYLTMTEKELRLADYFKIFVT